MMPNVKGSARTRLEILLYSLVLAPTGLLPWFMGFGGTAYGCVAAVGGLAMVIMAARIFTIREGKFANKVAMQMFGGSIVYLFMLFAVLLAERIVPLFGIWAGWIK